MKPLHSPASMVLRARRVHRIENGEGTTITCLKGNAWITQASDSRDIVLSPHESFQIDRQGLTLVMALTDAAITIAGPDQLRAAAGVQKQPARRAA